MQGPYPPTRTRRIKHLHHKVKRAKPSLITQMRTLKIDLKAFLYNRWVPGIEERIMRLWSSKADSSPRTS